MQSENQKEKIHLKKLLTVRTHSVWPYENEANVGI